MELSCDVNCPVLAMWNTSTYTQRRGSTVELCQRNGIGRGTGYIFVHCKKRPRGLEFHSNCTQSSLDCDFVNVECRLFLSPFLYYGTAKRKMVCACLVTILLVLYILFDVNYFLRIIFTITMGRLFEKRKKIMDTTTVYGICTTQDVDLFFKHMNNARYLRELDFARFHYYDRSGIYAAIAKRGGGAVQGASSTRYRRAIPILTPYKVNTKLIYWEDKHFYLEHEFISLSDNFVRAVILSRQTATGLKVPVSEIIANVEPNAQLPEMSKDLQLWLSSMEESSQKYKKQS